MAGQSSLLSRGEIISAVKNVEMTNRNNKSPMTSSKQEVINKNLSPKKTK